jgi:lycopene cyclase domain-containing protein
MSYLYLWLNIGTFLGPFVLSFDKKVAFFREWKYLFPAIFLMALVFITWDILFTISGIWGFNPAYLSGIFLFSLPIEEWLFFFTVPYACVFIYACVKVYFRDYLAPYGKKMGWITAVFTLLVGLVFVSRLYTSITFLATTLFILYLLIFTAFKWGRFWMAYLISLLPFLMVNGVLTGTCIQDEVVWYNEDQITTFRLLTIPIEDSIYNMLMLLMSIHFYELFKVKKRW